MPRVNVDKVQTQYRQINDFIRGEMRRKKISQMKLADYLGVGQPALSLRINGESEWTFRDILKVMEFLNVDITEVL